MAFQPVKYYQTGTFTVGNRLLPPETRSVQANMRRTNSLNSGHRACQGCGEALGARYAIDAAMEAVRRILETRRAALEAVTARLMESEVIDGDELRRLVEAATAAPVLVPGTVTDRRPVRPAVGDPPEAVAGGEA